MRLATIDTLRGLAIFAMILIHSAAYFTSDKAVFFVWNYSQFAVPIFFFCSAYLFFSKDTLPHIRNFLPYFKKRLLRLFIPYYIYLAILFVLIRLFEPHRLTGDFILQNIFLTTSNTDLNWIVLVFLALAFIHPLLSYLFAHKRVFFYIYASCSVATAGYFLFFDSPVNYKFIMWLPWSLISLFGLYFIRQEAKHWFYKATLLGTFLFFMIIFIMQVVLGYTLSFYDNKYPPNLYYLSYGLFSITALYYIVQKEVLKVHLIEKFLHFLSIHSYSLFFIHFLVIYTITQIVDINKFGWGGFFLIVLGVSLILQWLYLRFPDMKARLKLVK